MEIIVIGSENNFYSTIGNRLNQHIAISRIVVARVH